MRIKHTNEIEEARELAAAGWEPIECSFGEHGSVVGPLEMDHHGSFSHLEGVVLRAYRDHFGVRREDPSFVVTGAADADACFCIASLAGLLPHPSRVGEFEKAPPPVRTSMTRHLLTLTTLINQVDTNPIGIRQEETPEGCLLLLWNQTGGSTQDALEFYAGVSRWRSLLSRTPKALIEAVKAEEAERVIKARSFVRREVFGKVACLESEVWGFDVWYAEVAPVIVALTPQGNITVGCPSTEKAEALFGPGGLKNVWSKLAPEGWGGRESIGGSPRGQKLSWAEASEAARIIATNILTA